MKDTTAAKQRLATAAPAAFRQALALAMLEDVLAALVQVRGIAGRLLVTTDPDAIKLAARYEAHCLEDGAADGHTGAVMAAGRRLVREGRSGMMTLPGDVPLVTADEISQLLAEHLPAPAFTIAPSHDKQGSNAIILSPPDTVPLRFGDDSYYPHLAAAEARGIKPTIVPLPGIAFDIDNPEDLKRFAALGSDTRAGRLVAENAGMIEDI
ncbi:MAG: 2-phospho-L-lactate guanylyltransferase [Alphaproteobacteria bacterium]|nr:2-phospho-L-lactate guanylyltransferase [Alphaproteobacteria bacterium]